MSDGRGVAALQMYDLPEIRPAVDELWAAIRRQLGRGPDALIWDRPETGPWVDPDLVLAQTCGWPLATSLAGRVRTVGAFRYRLDGEPTRARYRSVIIGQDQRPLASLAGTTAAINRWDSLSGWVSLALAVAGDAHGRAFFGSVIETGGHVASIGAVRAGEADVASIDAVTHALLGRHRPGALEGLVVVGRGPLVPTLPLVTAAADPGPMRRAIGAALEDADTARSRTDLLIDSFVAVDEKAYRPVADLGPLARQVIPQGG